MTARVTPSHLEQTSAVEIGLPGGMSTMPGSLYREGARMRPTSVRIHRTGHQTYVSVYGITIRANGTEGVQEQYIGVSLPGQHRAWGSDLPWESAPDWLQDLVERYMPPEPAMRIGDDHE